MDGRHDVPPRHGRDRVGAVAGPRGCRRRERRRRQRSRTSATGFALGERGPRWWEAES